MQGEARKGRRFAVQLPATCTTGSGEQVGTVLNLSLQGCALMTEPVPVVSTYLSLQIALKDGEAPICIELAGVRWIAGHRCGLEFIRMVPEIEARLRDFVLLLETTP